MRINFPRLFNWLIIGVILFTDLNLKYWKDPDKVIAWDAISYYAYLPATFIYHDPTLQFTDHAPDEVRNKIWYQPTPTGGRAIKTSMGLSMLYAPFFFSAHLIAPVLGFEPNGYSTPYRFMLIMSCLFYVGLALYFLRKVLCSYFPSWVVIVTICSVVLGTNLFFYSAIESTMSHAYSFFLFAVFIYVTFKWYENPNAKWSVFLGALTGLIVLVRPTNVLLLLFMILWDVKSWNEFGDRIRLLISRYRLLLLMMVLFLVIWIPQLIYWKVVSGQWFYFSYGDNERFFFSDPQIIKGLFGYRKGWFLYTPLMLFAVAGIPFLYQSYKSFFIPVLVFTVLNIYIVLSWWSWWYGGGFGLRAFIDSYALLSIPLAAFIHKCSGKKTSLKIILVLLITILSCFNQFQTWQYWKSIIHWDSMSEKAYWASFCKQGFPDNYEQMLEHPDYDKAAKGER